MYGDAEDPEGNQKQPHDGYATRATSARGQHRKRRMQKRRNFAIAIPSVRQHYYATSNNEVPSVSGPISDPQATVF